MIAPSQTRQASHAMSKSARESTRTYEWGARLALAAIRARIGRHTDNGGDLRNLDRPIAFLCAHAHRDRLPPERVIIDLKLALEGWPELRELTPDVRVALRRAVVSRAIDTYFDQNR